MSEVDELRDEDLENKDGMDDDEKDDDDEEDE